MSRPLEQIGIGEPVALAVTKLERSPALLVLDGGRPRAVVSGTDAFRLPVHQPGRARQRIGPMSGDEGWGFETRAVHGGQEPDEATGVRLPRYVDGLAGN